VARAVKPGCQVKPAEPRVVSGFGSAIILSVVTNPALTGLFDLAMQKAVVKVTGHKNFKKNEEKPR
jgi:hypothetical protein